MMKSVVFLFAGFSVSHAFDILFSSQSAFDRVLSWASGVPGCGEIVVAATPQTQAAVEQAVAASGLKDVRVIVQPSWNTAALLESLASCCRRENADGAVYTIADRPFLDGALTAQVVEAHEKYLAEYTFADGYPAGFAPEVIASGTLSILAGLAADTQKAAGDAPVTAESIFNVIRGDVNSFEIETVIAPKDYRMLRLDFSCSVKANAVACSRLFDAVMEKNIPLDAGHLSDFAESDGAIQHTVPAFYSIEIAQNCNVPSVYNPYPAGFRARYGCLPYPAENPAPKNMEIDSFCSIIQAVSELSETAVVGLGSFAEPLTVPDIVPYIKAVLAHPGLSVLIETDGTLVTESLAGEIAAAVQEAAPRVNAASAVTWIVKIDAVTPETYGMLHCGEGMVSVQTFGNAVQALSVLCDFFPGCVYPQFLRMNANEPELEQFYRKYHDKESVSGGKLIIQKFDTFCGLLKDEKPADLSPLERNACWHLKRDMTILFDGSVPLCREMLFGSSIGNVLEDKLSDVWERSLATVEKHIQKKYDGACGSCDEYYTFNF